MMCFLLVTLLIVLLLAAHAVLWAPHGAPSVIVGRLLSA